MIDCRKGSIACRVMLGLAAMFVQLGSASAADVNLARAPIALSYPDQWSKTDPAGSLRLDDPAREVMIVFEVVQASAVDAALGNLQNKLKGLGLGQVAVSSEEERLINGMKAALKSGKAMLDGQPVQLGVGIIDVSAQQRLMLFTIVKDGAAAKHKDTVLEILESIRPIRG